MSTETLRIAIDRIGGQTALADYLSSHGWPKVRQGNISKWLRSATPESIPPAQYCPDIEAATGVRCEELRPDVKWSILRNGHAA